MLALLLGHFGAHKFYLGYAAQGAFLLLACLVGGILTQGWAIGLLWLVAAVEAFVYLTRTDEDFAETYVRRKRLWF